MEPRYLSRSSEQATGWMIRSLNPDRGTLFSLLRNRQERRWCPLHPTSCQLVPVFFRGGKAVWRDFGHSPLSDTENGNGWSCAFTFLICLPVVDLNLYICFHKEQAFCISVSLSCVLNISLLQCYCLFCYGDLLAAYF